VLGPEAAGALARRAQVAVMPLAEPADARGPSLDLADPDRDQARRAKHRCARSSERLAGGRLTVARPTQDLALLHQALGPSDQASGLFAAISALLGFLFAFNAMLLTAPERRQTIADLRVDGTRRTAIAQMVIFQALCLGLVASAVGLLAGYALAVGLFHQSTGYLSQAFTLGSATVVGTTPMLIALACGLARDVPRRVHTAARPAAGARQRRRLRRRHEPRQPARRRHPQQARGRGPRPAARWPARCSRSCHPRRWPRACCSRSRPMLAVPMALAGVMLLTDLIGERYQRLTILPVALTGLRATTLRSMALAATGAVALFGSMALGGARDDLLRGIGQVAHRFSGGAQLWVISPLDNQATVPFPARDHAARVAALPGVSAVGAYQGSFLDWGERRPWIIARPADATASVLEGQILQGQATTAALRLQEGGWIVLSKQIASEHHLELGEVVRLPTPTGFTELRLAATSTNFGWPTGVIFMDTRDYTRAFATAALTALGVDLRPSSNINNINRYKMEIERRLGPYSGLEVITPGTRAARIEASGGEGLGQLGEIAKLLLAATIIALVAALGSSIWQQRISLASLRLEGTRPGQLRRLLLVEALVMLCAGCITGALAGVYGQLIIDGYLKHVTGFPVASLVTAGRPLEIFVLVVLVVLALAAIPGWAASRVAPTLAFGEE
jgi:putative ABC transport system permease protein